MKSRPKPNVRLSSDRERRKKYLVKGVKKRGTNAAWVGLCSWTSRLVRVLALAALVGALYLGATRGWRKFFWQNPDYALRDIHFTTDGSLTREQALQAIKLKAGDNIFSYSITAAREALGKLPQVDAAEVRRYLPNRIDITVRERQPAAWVVPKLSDWNGNAEGAYLLDARGLVFQPRHIPHEFTTLPTIGGVQTEDLEPGKRIRKAEVDAALELLRRARETGAFKVTSIDVSKAYCMIVTDQKNARLTFGLDDIAGQLYRLSIVQSETALIGQEISTVNLIPARNIPVTFMPPAQPDTDDLFEPEPPPAKTVTTQSPPRAASSSRSKATTSAPPKAKPVPPTKKTVPPKPKENPEPKDESIGILKRFRTA
jgi:cell division protein FtsQ